MRVVKFELYGFTLVLTKCDLGYRLVVLKYIPSDVWTSETVEAVYESSYRTIQRYARRWNISIPKSVFDQLV